MIMLMHLIAYKAGTNQRLWHRKYHKLLCYTQVKGYLCVSIHTEEHSHLHPLYVSSVLLASYFVCGLWRGILE